MKALVLAGGLPQIHLIKKLKEYGYEVILADNTENPIAKTYADKHFRDSTLDINAIESRAVNEKVDLLMTVCTDQALNTVSLVSERLGLPCYIDSVTGQNVTNKKYMKEVFKNNNIPSAKHCILKKGEYKLESGLTFPLIVKPVDCNSSKGVKKVNNNAELKSALDMACEYSRTDNSIVEEYIDGKEISVDIYVNNGEPQILCVSESQKIKNNEKFIIFRTVVPAGITDVVYDKIKDSAKKIVTAFGLKTCPMLIQMLQKGDDIYIIEFSARTGGGLKYRLIKQLAGIDIIDAAIKASLNLDFNAQIKYNNKFCVNEFLYTIGGVYDHLAGFENLVNDGTLLSYDAFKSKGAEFDSINSSGDRVAGFTIMADTYNEYLSKYEKTIKSIKAIDSNGNDMLHHDLTYPVSKRELNNSLLRLLNQN